MGPRSLPAATVRETAAAIAEVFIPTVAKGPLLRRPRAVALAARLRLDERAVRRMQKLHSRHPAGPLLLRLPVRRQALILAPEDVGFVLDHSPEPFATASSEKRAALAHFEPGNVLISHGSECAARRSLQEQVLDSGHPVHHLAGHFLPVVRQETEELLHRAERDGGLDWDGFLQSWDRIVRRVVFGDTARDDRELTNMLTRLRADANWAFLKPRRDTLRARFLAGINERLAAAEEGSLAHSMAGMNPSGEAAALDQVPQWLFAIGNSGMAAFRTLAVLATHEDQAGQARQEVRSDRTGGAHLPYLRACVLETLRLWPTTPMILRQTTRAVQWEHGVMPARCGVLIYVPYFHRDERHLGHAHDFGPGRWLAEGTSGGWPLIPFSDGPAVCPGKQLTLLLTSAMLGCLVWDGRFTLASHHRLVPGRPLPGTLDHFSLRLSVAPRSGG
jgi:cytochrome P450